MKKIILILFTFTVCKIAQSQTNILPNGSFENPVVFNGNLQNNCVPFSVDNGGITQFNSLMDNWEIAQHNIGLNEGPVAIIQKNVCIGANSIPNKTKGFSNGPSPIGVHNDPQFFPNLTNKRFICLRADNNRFAPLNNACNTNRTNHGAIAVALENNVKFPQGVPMVIRYKIIPTRGMKDNSSNDVCNSNLFTHVRFFLSEKGPANWNDNSSDKQELISVNFNKNNANNTLLSGNDLIIMPGNWLQVERKFVPDQSNYTTLVVYMESGGCLIDDFEVFPECENTVTIQDKLYTNGVFLTNGIEGSNFKESAGDIIKAGSNVDITKPTGEVTIEFNSTILYTATNEIQLLDGFSSEQGSNFTAEIASCPNNLNRTSQYNNLNINPDPNYIPLQPLPSNEAALANKEKNTSNLNETIGIKIFPNPNNGVFSILFDANNSLPESITIRDSQGRILEELAEIKNYDQKFSLNNFSNGLYFVNINYSGKTISTKIIKQ